MVSKSQLREAGARWHRRAAPLLHTQGQRQLLRKRFQILPPTRLLLRTSALLVLQDWSTNRSVLGTLVSNCSCWASQQAGTVPLLFLSGGKGFSWGLGGTKKSSAGVASREGAAPDQNTAEMPAWTLDCDVSLENVAIPQLCRNPVWFFSS